MATRFDDAITPDSDPTDTAVLDDDSMDLDDGMDTESDVDEGSEQDTPPATDAGQKAVNWEKRYKDLQSDYTRKSQELASLKRKPKDAEADDAGARPNPKTSDDDFSEDRFEEIAEKDGRGAALRYLHESAAKKAMREMESNMSQRERQQTIAQRARDLFDEFGHSEDLIDSLRQLGEEEVAQGFHPSPGALYALAEAGGDWKEAIRLIRAAKGEGDAEPAPRSRRPASVPGGSANRSPAGSNKKSEEKLSSSDFWGK